MIQSLDFSLNLYFLNFSRQCNAYSRNSTKYIFVKSIFFSMLILYFHEYKEYNRQHNQRFLNTKFVNRPCVLSNQSVCIIELADVCVHGPFWLCYGSMGKFMFTINSILVIYRIIRIYSRRSIYRGDRLRYECVRCVRAWRMYVIT